MTIYVIDSAIGEDIEGSINTKGWFRIYPGKCKLVLNEKLKSKEYYIYAKTLVEYNKALDLFNGGQKLCISNDNFEHKSAHKCKNSSDKLVNFLQIINDEGKSYIQTILADNNPDKKFDKTSISTKGIQNLLDIIGYNVGDIDGKYGGNTKTALSKVVDNIDNILENNLFKDNVYEKLLDIISLQLDKLGLKICNETRFIIWAATAIKEGDKVRSKGWYRILSSECIKPHNQALDGSEIYIYGEAVDKDREISIVDNIPLIWSGDKKFCIMENSFNLTEHEDCTKGELKSQSFQTIPLKGSINWTIRFAEP